MPGQGWASMPKNGAKEKQVNREGSTHNTVTRAYTFIGTHSCGSFCFVFFARVTQHGREKEVGHWDIAGHVYNMAWIK